MGRYNKRSNQFKTHYSIDSSFVRGLQLDDKKISFIEEVVSKMKASTLCESELK